MLRYRVSMLGMDAEGNPSFWLYSLLVHEHALEPDELVTALAIRGIQSRRLWPPIDQQTPYRSAERLRGDVAGRLYHGGLSLPSSPHLTQAEQRIVIDELRDLLE